MSGGTWGYPSLGMNSSRYSVLPTKGKPGPTSAGSETGTSASALGTKWSVYVVPPDSQGIGGRPSGMPVGSLPAESLGVN